MSSDIGRSGSASSCAGPWRRPGCPSSPSISIPEATPFKDLCERVLETEQEVTNCELRVARPEGDHDWLVSVHPVRDEAGTMLGINVVVQEVTERKRAEQALLESEQALREAGRRKDEFLVMLAHELRNPLAPIRTAIQVLDITGGDAPEAARTREMIERQVSHMARMIDDLLDVSRIARGKSTMRSSSRTRGAGWSPPWRRIRRRAPRCSWWTIRGSAWIHR